MSIPPRGSVLHRHAALLITLGILLAACLFHTWIVYEPEGYLIGDSPYYAQTAISLAVDGDLDLANNLRGGASPHARQVSLGARGEWYPKHPILMPILSLPLLPLFGMKAFLIMNVAVLLALGWAVFALCRLTATPQAALAATLGSFLGSYLILYGYNYSPDLLSCLFLAAAVLAAVTGRSTLAGLLAGLTVFTSTSRLVLLPLFAVWVLWRHRWRGAALFVAGCAAPLLVQAGLNWWMFGSPLLSPYMRILDEHAGQIYIRSHMSDFTNPLWDGVVGQLLDPRKGLLFTAPVLLASALGLPLWFRKRPDLLVLCVGLSEFQFLFFATYRLWPTSHVGNRFLMPVVALSAPGLACLADWLLARARAALPQPAGAGLPGSGSGA